MIESNSSKFTVIKSNLVTSYLWVKYEPKTKSSVLNLQNEGHWLTCKETGSHFLTSVVLSAQGAR